ncbi:MAG: hypothetical protein KatS3mg020_0686 [Fimbriimonadales bacterium]|nr:MAG: hypothetical protein KatS3mg020_0686 [Fimbriimonadales bacterium]
MASPISEIVARLESRYGVPQWNSRNNPLEELIHCILSQHTSDANSFRAYRLLRERYPTWQAVVDAPTDELAETIRSGGLANQKAPRIQAVLKTIYETCGEYDLDWLHALPTPEAKQFLLSLPGIGPKCAAIVLCFAMGRPVIPVDTHVFRVCLAAGADCQIAGRGKSARRAGSDDPRTAGLSIPCRVDTARALCMQSAEPALRRLPTARVLRVLLKAGLGSLYTKPLS